MDLLTLNSVAIIPQLKENFSAEKFKIQHYEQVMDVFIHAFCDSEPMTKYINMQYAEFYPFAEAVTQKAVIDGFSSVIIEKRSGRVVALSLVEDITDPAKLDMPLTPKFGPILSLLEQLSSEYFKHNLPSKNQIAHLFISAVDESYRGLGLSTQANFFAMQLAKKKNFTLMVSELTNYINEKGIIPYLKEYKERIGAIKYSEFKFEHTKPFNTLAGEAHAFIWDIPEIIICK